MNFFFFFEGFVSGGKILLPEHHTRKDTKIYEEVSIPISFISSLPVKYDPIYISSLDKVNSYGIVLFNVFVISKITQNFLYIF